MRRGSAAALVACFVAAISTPLVATIAGRDGGDPKAENRDLAPFPRFSDLRSYASGLSAWFEDHFAFRAEMVRWFGELRLFALGAPPNGSVVIGRDGWFFYAEDDTIDDFTNQSLLTPGEIMNWRAAITDAAKWTRSRRGTYLFTIAPDKHVIYGDKLPPTVRQVERTSRTDQVLNAISDLGVGLDLRPGLIEARRAERVYHRTDTHWNDRGVFAAYQQIIGALRLRNPAIPPAWPRANFEPVAHDGSGHDLARMMGLGRVLVEEELELEPTRARRAIVVEPAGAEKNAEVGRLVTEIPGSPLPRAVIFRDSYVSALVPFLSEHFSRAVYLWQNDFDADVVAAEHADVVIQEIVGRHLYSYVPTPSLIPAP